MDSVNRSTRRSVSAPKRPPHAFATTNNPPRMMRAIMRKVLARLFKFRHTPGGMSMPDLTPDKGSLPPPHRLRVASLTRIGPIGLRSSCGKTAMVASGVATGTEPDARPCHCHRPWAPYSLVGSSGWLRFCVASSCCFSVGLVVSQLVSAVDRGGSIISLHQMIWSLPLKLHEPSGYEICNVYGSSENRSATERHVAVPSDEHGLSRPTRRGPGVRDPVGRPRLRARLLESSGVVGIIVERLVSTRV